MKRLLVIAGFLTFFGVIGGLIYIAFIRVAPTCTDGKQNQKEEGIDCGGVCAKRCEPPLQTEQLETKEVAWMPTGSGMYDALVKVYNPNDIAGASLFTYTVSLKDATGRTLVERRGTSFILPQETKYLVEFQLATTFEPAQATVVFSDVTWERFEGYTEKPRISVTHQAYGKVTSGPGYGAATGLVMNESPYDFRSILVKVVLRDASGKPIGVNMTEMRTMRSKEQRDFRLVWPTAFPGEVVTSEMVVDADVYHTSNFIRQYSPTTPF